MSDFNPPGRPSDSRKSEPRFFCFSKSPQPLFLKEGLLFGSLRLLEKEKKKKFLSLCRKRGMAKQELEKLKAGAETEICEVKQEFKKWKEGGKVGVELEICEIKKLRKGC